MALNAAWHLDFPPVKTAKLVRLNIHSPPGKQMSAYDRGPV